MGATTQLFLLAILFVGGALGAVLLAPQGRGPEHVDPCVAAVLSVLPGGNCGACGNDSCFTAAAAIVAGEAPPSVCVTGGEQTAAAVDAVLEKCPGR